MDGATSECTEFVYMKAERGLPLESASFSHLCEDAAVKIILNHGEMR